MSLGQFQIVEMTICNVPPWHGMGWTVATRKCTKSNSPCGQKDEDNSWRTGPLGASKCDNLIRASHCWWLDVQRKQGSVSLYTLHFLEPWTNIYLRPLVGRVLGWLKKMLFCTPTLCFSAPKHSSAFGAVTCITTSRCSCVAFQNRYWCSAAGMIGLSRDNRKPCPALLYFFIFLICSLFSHVRSGVLRNPWRQ